MISDIECVLISEETLKNKVYEIGKEISKDYYGKDLVVVGILKGSCVFMCDLIRCIDLPLSIDFMAVSSYASGTTSNGKPKITQDLNCNIENKDILIIEDILDSGATLKFLMNELQQRNPKSIKICSLLNKPKRRKVDIKLDYEGFEIPDEFIVGFGLDYNQKYRNLPYIAVLKKSVYEK